MYVQAASSPIGLLHNKPALIGRSGDVFVVPHVHRWHLLLQIPFNVMIDVRSY